jgi:hypothetical protein
MEHGSGELAFHLGDADAQFVPDLVEIEIAKSVQIEHGAWQRFHRIERVAEAAKLFRESAFLCHGTAPDGNQRHHPAPLVGTD